MGESAPAADGRELVMPLLLETLIALVLAYLIGVGLAWLFFGRARRDTYL